MDEGGREEKVAGVGLREVSLDQVGIVCVVFRPGRTSMILEFYAVRFRALRWEVMYKLPCDGVVGWASGSVEYQAQNEAATSQTSADPSKRALSLSLHFSLSTQTRTASRTASPGHQSRSYNPSTPVPHRRSLLAFGCY